LSQGAPCAAPARRYRGREAVVLEELPLPLLIALIALAVAAGLYLGYRAGKAVPRAGSRDSGKSIVTRAREATTSGIVKLWKWNRARKKSRDKA
jgi:hypothetical protein